MTYCSRSWPVSTVAGRTGPWAAYRYSSLVLLQHEEQLSCGCCSGQRLSWPESAMEALNSQHKTATLQPSEKRARGKRHQRQTHDKARAAACTQAKQKSGDQGHGFPHQCWTWCPDLLCLATTKRESLYDNSTQAGPKHTARCSTCSLRGPKNQKLKDQKLKGYHAFRQVATAAVLWGESIPDDLTSYQASLKLQSCDRCLNHL